MALKVKAITVKSEDFCLVPRTHMVRENSPRVVLRLPHIWHIIHMRMYVCTKKKKNESKGWWLASKPYFRKREEACTIKLESS